MDTNAYIQAFKQLGDKLQNDINSNAIDSVLLTAENANPWFTKNFSLMQIQSIIDEFLNLNKLKEWVSHYPIIVQERKTYKVGVIAAGNIPLVCFQDLICVLITGNIVYLKLSSKDEVIPKYVINCLFNIEPAFKSKIIIQDILKGYDKIIATGSDNTTRYFEYYFKDYPKIIRGNRLSVAILDEKTTPEEMFLLGNDIFSFYGLGCRNVIKLYLKQDFDVVKLLDELFKHEEVGQFFKYNNNYMYHKSIFLLNKTKHLDTGFVLFKEDESLTPPTGVIFYEYYNDETHLLELLKTKEHKIQSYVASSKSEINGIKTTPFGKSQMPSLLDYADGVDVVQFLLAD